MQTLKLKTLIESQKKLVKAEVEVVLIPGVPQIHFLGLPDKSIKESFYRIKSALKACGYKFPVTHQVIVNIKPTYLKKSSLGLELAVAMGILKLTGQNHFENLNLNEFLIYGELDLDGSVREPNDLKNYINHEHTEDLLTGHVISHYHHSIYELKHLKSTIDKIRTQSIPKLRPQIGLDSLFTKDEAELIFLMAITKFHTLLAGATGSGKTTLAKKYISFTPDDHQSPEEWRKVISPHHSLTAAAFIGGGNQLYQGELERIDNGILILDELLEFNPQVIELLRGPMTGDKMRLARGGQYREFDFNFQVVGTTNLCPCGKKTNIDESTNCRFSVKKCQTYQERLSGPILDRFGLFFINTNRKIKRTVRGEEILERIERYESEQSEVFLNEDLFQTLYPEITPRRAHALKTVARIYANEDLVNEVSLTHLSQAERWTYRSFKEFEG